MAGRQRTTFAKLQRERARQAKQAAKRARRQGIEVHDSTPHHTPAAVPQVFSWRDLVDPSEAAAIEGSGAEPGSPDAGTGR